MADYVFTAELDDSQVLKALDNIDKRVDQLVGDADSSFKALAVSGKSAFDEIRKVSSIISADIVDNLEGIGAHFRVITNTANELNSVLLQTRQIVNNIQPVSQPQQQTGVDDSSFRQTTRSVSQLEEEYKRLLVAQVKLAVGSDKNAKQFINQADAATKTAGAFLDVISTTDRITDEQLDLAQGIAETQEEIIQLTKVLENQGDTTGAVLARIRQLRGELDNLAQVEDEAAEAIRRATIQARRQVASQAQLERQQRQAARNFIRNARAIDDVRDSLRKVLNETGTYTITLGRNDEALDSNQRRILRAINNNRQLKREVDRLTNEVGEFNVTLDRTTFGRQQAQSAGFSFTELRSKMSIVVTVLKEIFRIGTDVLRPVIAGLQEAIKEATKFNTVFLGLKNILDGNASAARSVAFEIRALSERLGTDASGLAQAFFPLVESLEQFEQLATLSVGLKVLSTATGKVATQAEIVRSVAEATSGDFRSLRAIFELIPAETKKLDKAFDEFGIGGFIEELEKVFQARGIDIEELLETLPVLKDRFEQTFKSLAITIGEPVNEALTDFMVRLLELIDENRDELEIFARTLGQFIADIATFTGDEIIEFLESLDTEKQTNALNDLKDLFDVLVVIVPEISSNISAISDVLNALPVVDVTNNFSFLKTILNELADILQEDTKLIRDFLESVGINFTPLDKILDIFRDTRNFAGELIDQFGVLNLLTIAIAGSFGFARATVQGLIDDLKSGISVFQTIGDFLSDPRGFVFEKGDQEDLQNAIDFVNDLTTAIAENNAQLALLEAQTEASTEAQLEYANAIKQVTFLTNELERTNEKLVEAQEKVDEAQEKLNLELLRSSLDLVRENERKRIQLEIDSAREREKIARKFADKEEDIFRKNFEKEQDILKDAGRKAEDLDKKRRRKTEDEERKANDRRAEIELAFRRRLEDIRDKFQFDALEAIRQNDAIRFLQLKRRAEFEEREARKRRDRELEDLRDDEEQKRKQRQVEANRATDDARTDLQRRLADLEDELQRELEALRIANERELREQNIKEKQKQFDLNESFAQQLEDFAEFAERKQEDLEKSLEDEQTIIDEANQKIEELNDAFREAESAKWSAWRASELEKDENFQEARTRIRDVAPRLTDRQAENIISTSSVTEPPRQRFNPENASIPELKVRIRNLARRLGRLSIPFSRDLNDADRNELIALYRELLADIPAGGIPRRLGGSILPGLTYLVGEQGPELLRFSGSNFIGQVLPNLGANAFSLPSQSVSRTVDNRRSIDVGGINLIDPSSFSPDQIAIITKVMKQILLESLGGI